jgi:hypothetical protein
MPKSFHETIVARVAWVEFGTPEGWNGIAQANSPGVPGVPWVIAF